MPVSTFPELPERASYEDDAAYMKAAIALLDHHVSGRDPVTAEEWVALQRQLFAVGRHDLPLGRVFEGHVDARQVLNRIGADLPSNPIFGMWNAEADGWHLEATSNGVTGGKSYASGTGIVTHALVSSSAGTSDVQLHLVDLMEEPPTVGANWWNVKGMQRSQTHRVRWANAAATSIGKPGDYERAPWFFTGALRFATVQAGGIAGVRDAVRDTLVSAGRAGDAIQARRLSRLHMLAQSAVSVVLETGRALPATPISAQPVLVSNARNAVYEFAEETIAEAARAVGTRAYFEGDPVADRIADLAMYIRQPGPDAQHQHVAKAVADGSLDFIT